jgi:hypothetical protein
MENLMKYQITLVCALVGLSLLSGACKSEAPKTTTPAPTTPPAATAPAKPAAGTPAAGTAKTAESSPNPDAAKKTVPAAKKVEVPANWVTMYDEQKGYEFEVPEGSKTDDQSVEGVDVFTATTPENVEALVVTYNNKDLDKDDLLEDAEKILKALGCKDIKIGTETELNDDYGLAEATFTDPDGKKNKVKILVATDVTDNYIVIVGTEESQFSAKEKIIDGIWGSFSMYSGGASGKS